MKRFWSTATVVPDNGLLTIALDGRPMRLPGGPTLHLHQPALAQAIADEWAASPADMSPDHVPLTRLAGTAQDRIAPNPAPTIAAIAAYAATDLLCYRATGPEALVVRQHHAWQPWLDWAAATYGARLTWTAGIMPITQDPQALAALHKAVSTFDPFALAGLGLLVPALGSLVLGLAVATGQLPAAEAHRLSILDELYEEDLWGPDAEATARRAHVARDIETASRFIALSAS